MIAEAIVAVKPAPAAGAIANADDAAIGTQHQIIAGQGVAIDSELQPAFDRDGARVVIQRHSAAVAHENQHLRAGS